MRVPLHDVAVLEGSRLALVRVDDQILWFGNLVDHLFRSHRGESFPGGEISAASEVVFEPRSAWIFEARGKHRPVRADEGFGLWRRFRFPGFHERVLDDPVDGLTLKRADEAFVELGHGRHLASAQALDLREGDFPTRRGLAWADLQVRLDPIQQIPGPAQNAWQTCADP